MSIYWILKRYNETLFENKDSTRDFFLFYELYTVNGKYVWQLRSLTLLELTPYYSWLRQMLDILRILMQNEFISLLYSAPMTLRNFKLLWSSMTKRQVIRSTAVKNVTEWPSTDYTVLNKAY